MEKVKTGIAGFDDLTGGIPKGTRTILYGPSGTGKTVFAMQFLWTGLQNGEVVCYDVFDRPFPYVRRYFKSFGWDIEPYEKEGKFVGLQAFPHFEEYERDPRVLYFTMKHLSDLKKIDKELTQKGVTRLVAGDNSKAIFSLFSLENFLPIENWTTYWNFFDGITDVDVFTAAEIEDSHLDKGWAMNVKGAQNFIEFKTDGAQRLLHVVKMEGSSHPLDWIPFKITQNGIIIKS